MSEIMDALTMLEEEKNISKEDMIVAIENAIKSACENDYDKDSIEVKMDRETGEIKIYAERVVVDEIMDPNTDIMIDEARHVDPNCEPGDEIMWDITTKDFGRIAAQKARGIILQGIKEKEKKANVEFFKSKEHEIVIGTVQRFVGNNNLSVSLYDRIDTVLNQREMIPGERYHIGDKIKLYVVEVKEQNDQGDKEDVKDKKGKKRPKNGFKVVTSRTHPNFVKKLFEREVSEIADGIVEIMSISREAGSRSKMAVWSNDPDIDAVGSCVGLNSNRINAVTSDLGDEKIDIVDWDPDPAVFIENALRPSPVISVEADEEAKIARVIVPDEKLSLAIGREGQNARLAARLTGYKIDIMSKSQADNADFDEEYEYEEVEEDDDAISDEAVDAAIEEFEAETQEAAEEVEESAEEEAPEAAEEEASDDAAEAEEESSEE